VLRYILKANSETCSNIIVIHVPWEDEIAHPPANLNTSSHSIIAFNTFYNKLYSSFLFVPDDIQTNNSVEKIGDMVCLDCKSNDCLKFSRFSSAGTGCTNNRYKCSKCGNGAITYKKV
jgi:hypothetical protein